jgi:hypothetical protein
MTTPIAEHATAEEIAAYAAREIASPETLEFVGGAEVFISVSFLAILLIVILVVVLSD